MKLKSVFPLGMLVVGGAVGFGWRCMRAANSGDPSAAVAPTAVATSETNAEAEALRAKLTAMRQRIKELEAKIVARQDGDAETEVETYRQSQTEADKRPMDLGAQRLMYVMKLKEEDPKQFVYLTNRMDRTSRWQRQQAQVRIDYFKRADVTKMTETERAVHEDLLACQEALGRIGEIGGIWDRSAEVENACVAEKREIKDRLQDLYHAEARTLVRLKALELGYTPDDSEEIAESVAGLLQATYNATEYTGMVD